MGTKQNRKFKTARPWMLEGTVNRTSGYYGWCGERHRSVTTILRDTLGTGEGLVNWAARMVARRVTDLLREYDTLTDALDQATDDETKKTLRLYGMTGNRLMATLRDEEYLAKAPYEFRDKAGKRGSRVHDALPTIALENRIPETANEDAAARLPGFLTAWQQHGFKLEVLECMVLNRTLKFAGTLDILAYDPAGALWLLDIKTSKNTYVDNALQLGGYESGEVLCIKGATPDTWTDEIPGLKFVDDGAEVPMPKIDRRGVLLVGTHKTVLYEWPDMKDAWAMLLDFNRRLKGVESTPIYGD